MKRSLLVLALLLAGCSSGGSFVETGRVSAGGPTSAQTVKLETTDRLSFVPNVVDAKVGRLTITLDNSGVIPHNLQFAGTGLGGTGTINGHSTATLSLSFTKPGTYSFVCTFHSGMRGKVVVTGS